MTSTFTIECKVHFSGRGRGSRKRQHRDSAAEAGRVPRVSRLMALAIRFDQLIRAGEISGYAELAKLGHVTRARMSQIASLCMLASDVQEAVLFLPRTLQGRDSIQLRDLLPIATIPDWRRQRTRWKQLTSVSGPMHTRPVVTSSR